MRENSEEDVHHAKIPGGAKAPGRRRENRRVQSIPSAGPHLANGDVGPSWYLGRWCEADAIDSGAPVVAGGGSRVPSAESWHCIHKMGRSRAAAAQSVWIA